MTKNRGCSMYYPHTAHQIGALQFQLQKILFGTSQKCRDGQQTLISCTSFQILHLQLAVLFQTKSPMSTFSVSGPKILSHIMPRSADDDTAQWSNLGVHKDISVFWHFSASWWKQKLRGTSQMSKKIFFKNILKIFLSKIKYLKNIFHISKGKQHFWA